MSRWRVVIIRYQLGWARSKTCSPGWLWSRSEVARSHKVKTGFQQLTEALSSRRGFLQPRLREFKCQELIMSTNFSVSRVHFNASLSLLLWAGNCGALLIKNMSQEGSQKKNMKLFRCQVTWSRKRRCEVWPLWWASFYSYMFSRDYREEWFLRSCVRDELLLYWVVQKTVKKIPQMYTEGETQTTATDQNFTRD